MGGPTHYTDPISEPSFDFTFTIGPELDNIDKPESKVQNLSLSPGGPKSILRVKWERLFLDEGLSLKSHGLVPLPYRACMIWKSIFQDKLKSPSGAVKCL